MNDQPVSPDAVAEAVGPGLGAGVLSGAAELVPIPVPGVRTTVVWQVRGDHLDHPLQAYVGRWPDGEVRLLSDDQDAWTELMGAVGVDIGDATTALGYVRHFLEITRAPSVIVLELTSVEDLQWRPGSDLEEQRKADFLSAATIPGPVVARTADGFHVELTLVVAQRVQRNVFDVTADGRIDASFEVLAEDLPLPIIL
jgi:hypothetical protein